MNITTQTNTVLIGLKTPIEIFKLRVILHFMSEEYFQLKKRLKGKLINVI
jgi:hypothetical protein